MQRSQHLDTGANGEEAALNYLLKQGWQLVERNWHCSAGEIDLVMRDGAELVLVEVKTRIGEYSGRAEDAVTKRKARRSLAAGEWYVQQRDVPPSTIWRIDLVAVTMTPVGGIIRIAHIENAILSG